jgi:hypothetical protein
VPTTEDELGGLNSDQRRDLDDRARRLQSALRAGDTVIDLCRFLPPPGAPHRRAVLHELIKTELGVRYSRRQGGRLEEFLRRYPELGAPEDLPAELLYEEYRLRQTFGDRPALGEYHDRFPLQFEQFRRLAQQAPGEAPPTNYHTLAPPAPAGDPVLTVRQTSVPAAPTPPVRRTSAVLPPGEGYQLLERIGNGQFGEVYRAHAPGGVVVAVKRILRSMNDESSRRELKAMEQLRELRHPFLLQTHNYYALEDRLIIVMELADGSLLDRFKECRAEGMEGIPVDELLSYFGEAAEALDYLRGQKLSHRDIKPQNLLHLKGHAKVADFGLARIQQQTLDHTVNVGGTPAYMPPEMWRGDVSVHSDQYSLAATWYEMRTGRRLFSANSHAELLMQHLTQPPDVSGVPEAEQAVLLRALAKEPDQRFPSCVAFVQALREATAPPKPVASAPAWGVKAAAVSLALAVTAILVATGGVLWRWRQQPPPPAVPEPPKVAVSWQPRGWDPEDASDVVEDRNGRRYYRRLVRDVGGQRVVAVVVPQTRPTDPRTFYVLENKVCNALYAAFLGDQKSARLLETYSHRPGCEALVRGDWDKGGWAPHFNDDPDKAPFFGATLPARGPLPVFRATVTEAHCFAEWLDGRLPTRQQWRKAAGKDEDGRPGPFAGDPADTEDLAVGLVDGPWPVNQGSRDVSIHGCRQMATNGYEWTRDLDDNNSEIPLQEMHGVRQVYVQGQSYLSREPLTFKGMAEPSVRPCTKADPEVSFRVVLEQP